MDIIIAGGGIVGCYAGQLLRQKGLNPLIIEEHPEVGAPVQCAGLIGREAVETSRVPFPPEVILRSIHGARLYLGNEWFEIERTKAAYVVDRANLDKAFSKELNLHTRERVTTFTQDTAIMVTTNRTMYTCDLLLGCDGPFSTIRRRGPFPLTPSFYTGAQYIVDLPPQDDFVELHLRKPFFIWVIPEREETTRIGFVGPDPFHELDRFLERREIRADILSRQAGIIPLGYGTIARKNVALLGDAACQLKPTTGGGIFYGMKAAEIAVNSLDDLTKYEKKWKEQFGNEIKFGLTLRKIYEHIDGKNLERAFYIFKENRDVIETVADFERHTSLKEFLKYPLFLKLAGAALKEFLT